MIEHAPFIVSLGPMQISGYGVGLASAALLGYLVVAREYARLDVSAAALEDIVFLLLAAIVGAKGYDVLTGGASWGSRGGFSMVGGGLVALPLTWWFARRRGVALSTVADAVSLGCAAAVPVARTGCWAVGDDYGIPFTGPWAVAFPHGAPPSTAAAFRSQFGIVLPDVPDSAVIAVHPSQLYDVIVGTLVFLWLWRRRTQVPPLHTAGAFLLASAAVRFGMEFLRAKSDRVLPLGFTITQLVMIGLMGLGAFLLAHARRRVRVTTA